MRIILLACLVLFFVGCSQHSVAQDSSLESDSHNHACSTKANVQEDPSFNQDCVLENTLQTNWSCGPEYKIPKSGFYNPNDTALESFWGVEVGNLWEVTCISIGIFGTQVFQCPKPYFWKKVGDHSWACIK